MGALAWRDEYNINVATIDGQHRKLADLVNRLHHTAATGGSSKAITACLQELIGFTRLHFATEEQLMLQYGYPDYESHKRKHNFLMAQLHALAGALSYGHGPAFSGETERSGDWVMTHLLESDTKLGRYLNSKSVF